MKNIVIIIDNDSTTLLGARATNKSLLEISKLFKKSKQLNSGDSISVYYIQKCISNINNNLFKHLLISEYNNGWSKTNKCWKDIVALTICKNALEFAESEGIKDAKEFIDYPISWDIDVINSIVE